MFAGRLIALLDHIVWRMHGHLDGHVPSIDGFPLKIFPMESSCGHACASACANQHVPDRARLDVKLMRMLSSSKRRWKQHQSP